MESNLMIVVIDYGVGNLGSMANMLKKVRAEAMISSDISDIERADKLILPGVGAFDHCARNLEEGGFIPVLNKKVLQDKTPILGVCVGMQLLTRRSEEGNLPGLGWIEADIVRFKFDSTQSDLKIPHMDWNYINIKQESTIWQDMYDEPRFYFVHSYHAVCDNETNVLTTTHYGYEFASAIIRENIIGTQFHPEKSHKYGMKLLHNFAEHFNYDEAKSHSLLVTQG
jgi:glutamine amidotransferase